jgi:hypothetical protein
VVFGTGDVEHAEVQGRSGAGRSGAGSKNGGLSQKCSVSSHATRKGTVFGAFRLLYAAKAKSIEVMELLAQGMSKPFADFKLICPKNSKVWTCFKDMSILWTCFSKTYYLGWRYEV